MSDSPRQSVEPPSPRGFGALAERIASWTTRFLLTVMVLVAGVAVARQVTIWWREDRGGVVEVAAPAALPDDLGDPTQTQTLQFGDSPWGMERQSLQGPIKAAVAALRESCRKALERGPVAPDEPQKNELALLASLAARRPVDERPGRWQIYEMAGGFPAVVGISKQGGGTPQPAGKPVAGSTVRMVTWGLGVPTENEAWTLYTFFPSASTDVGRQAWAEVPLPPGAQGLFAIRMSGGGGIRTFKGVNASQRWTQFYDQWFRQQGWTSADVWQRRGVAWHARYARAPSIVADVQWTADDRGESTGLILVTPGEHRIEGR